jgi:ADP-ribosylglycohydrolase
MRERAEAMVLASFVADSHALGAHMMYSMDEIASRHGRVERLLPPPPGSAHNGRPAGAQTSIGDQTLLLLRHLASHRAFDPPAFAAEWRTFMAANDGHRDEATAVTLANMGAGRPVVEAGSDSEDLAAVSRVAPIVCRYRDDRNRLIEAAQAQARITHNSSLAVETSGYIARVLWNVLNGNTPLSAITAVADAAEHRVADLLRAGLQSIDMGSGDAALTFGQGPRIESGLPLVVHLIAKYEGSLKDALIENVAAGGDSAARGMVVGMILGAFHGRDAIPDDWIESLRAYREISVLLEDLEAALLRSTTEAVSTAPWDA